MKHDWGCTGSCNLMNIITNRQINSISGSQSIEAEEMTVKVSSDSTVSTGDVTSSISHVVVLGEIVGATNLMAALRENGTEVKNSPSSQQKAESCVNAFCNIYFGDTLIHRTKIISNK